MPYRISDSTVLIFGRMSDDNYGEGDEGRGADDNEDMEDNEEVFEESLGNSLDEEDNDEEESGESDEDGSDIRLDDE